MQSLENRNLFLATARLDSMYHVKQLEKLFVCFFYFYFFKFYATWAMDT